MSNVIAETSAESVVVANAPVIKKAQCKRYIAFSLWLIDKLPIAPENRTAALEVMHLFDTQDQQMDFFNTFDEKETEKVVKDIVKVQKAALKPPSNAKPRAPRPSRAKKPALLLNNAAIAPEPAPEPAPAPVIIPVIVESQPAPIQVITEIAPTVSVPEIVQQVPVPDIVESAPAPIPEIVQPVPVLAVVPVKKAKAPRKPKVAVASSDIGSSSSSTASSVAKPKKPRAKAQPKAVVPKPTTQALEEEPVMVNGLFVPRSPQYPPPADLYKSDGELSEESDDETEINGNAVTLNGRSVYTNGKGEYFSLIAPHAQLYE